MDGVVDEFVVPTGTLALAINWHFDRIGALTTRKGYAIVGAQISAGNAVLGLHQFLDEGSGTNDQLIAVVNTVAYYLSAGTWTSKRTSLTAGSKARFVNYLDFVWMVNGTEATAVWDGAAANSFVTTGNAASAPTGKYIEVFRNRVWIAGNTTNPSRVTYSSLPSAGVVLWTGSDTGTIDVVPNDGGDITAIKKFARALYVFKPDFMYRIYSINETEPDPQIFVGTYSQESVVIAKDGMYWHHPSGIYRLRKGEEQPREISKPVNEIIKNIGYSFYDDVNSWTDEDHVYFSVGDITLNSNTENALTINNCVLRWTISTEVWTIYSYASEFRVGAQYDNGSGLVQVVGDSDGTVYTVNSGNTDNSAKIHCHLETQWENFTGLRSETKEIRKFSALHENAQGAMLGYRTQTNTKAVEPIGQLESPDTIFKKNIRCKKIKFVLSVSTSGGQMVFQGFELHDIKNLGLLE